MKKTILTTALVFTSTAQAHTLSLLPEGLVHELLHAAPLIVPLLLAAVLVKIYWVK